MSIVPYEQFISNDGIEVVIEHATQGAFFTISGYARVSGLDKSTVSRRLKGVASDLWKTAEIHTPGGLQGVALIPASLAFKWAIKDDPDLALKMGECGATVYAYQLAGYQVSAQPSPEPKKAISYYTDRVIHMRKHLVAPKDYWCVVQKSAHLLSAGCCR